MPETERDPGTACIVSPHFDDAVLSCAGLIAGAGASTVLTVFSGGPPRAGQISSWDRRCGFTVGDDVMAARAAEDAAALACLGAKPAALGFSQYRAAVPNWARFVVARTIRYVRLHSSGGRLVGRIASALDEQLQTIGATSCAAPLGVAHPDHRITALACLEVARRRPHIRWLIYEDMPYSVRSPSGRERALSGLARAGFTLSPVNFELEQGPARKHAALQCYRSQLEALGDDLQIALTRPERYYVLGESAASTA